MKYQKTIKIPIHYRTTKEKLDNTKLNRKALRELIRNSDVVTKAGLSAGFIDQCIDKVLWSWKAYKRMHKKFFKSLNVIRNFIFYAHISITKECEKGKGKVKNAGGIDLGLNQPIAIVLLDESEPYEGFIGSEKREELLKKYEQLISELQHAGKWRKLRQLRNRRKKIAINYD